MPEPDGHSEPRAEWGGEDVERAARTLYEKDTLLNPGRWRGLTWVDLSGSEQGIFKDHALAVLSSIEAVPRAAMVDAEDRANHHALEVARSHDLIESLRARCEGVAKELRDLADFTGPRTTEQTVKWARGIAVRLGGPDDAPKEPTRKPKMCPDCGEPLNEPGRPGHGGGPPVPPKIHGHLGYRHSCGSLPERDR